MPSADDRNWFGRVRPRWSLARQLFVLQVVVVAVVVLTGALLAWYDAGQRNEEKATDKVLTVARVLAAQPAVRDGLTAPDPTATLQPLAERVRAETGVDFITIMSPAGIRYTHPDPTRIGQPFIGHIEQAVAGQVFTETYTGTLGPSVRAVVPVYDDAHRLVGLVSDGITVLMLTAELRDQVTALVVVAVGALLVGGLLTYLVSARIRRHTHGLRPAELSRMYEYHDAILHAVREGLLLVAPSGQITLCNDGAAVLLSLDPLETEGKHVSELGLPQSLVETLATGRAVRDEVHLTDDHVLLVNVSQIRSGERDLGTVVTLRDHTELQALSGELDSMRGFAESLRSQAHESANRLHTVVSLIELGRAEEAVAFATAELRLAQQLTDRVVGAVGESVLAAVLLGKSAEAGERGVEVVLSADTEIDDIDVGHIDSRDLVTILGNLIDNAVEATMESARPRVEVTLRSTEDGVLIQVADNGPGVDPGSAQRVFQRGWSTKDDGRGLGLALVGQSVRRHRGSIDVHNEGGAVFTVLLPSRFGCRGSDVAR
ncbi:sensor histidine kinase [Saccharopolyspora sp. ASAGF58]|uniref:sensor histidine kinase n=1 Tax=Saccharopolyspora sp. ASAGF58 TaxID=2719023 RepID=UPI0014402885|nr:sensor histidine kinase [Saccharopolyspora sp. ASAGF58]QIZ34044.1 sensor histidine kinase [Saccharopolyspora sp. ASAGF58]